MKINIETYDPQGGTMDESEIGLAVYAEGYLIRRVANGPWVATKHRYLAYQQGYAFSADVIEERKIPRKKRSTYDADVFVAATDLFFATPMYHVGVFAPGETKPLEVSIVGTMRTVMRCNLDDGSSDGIPVLRKGKQPIVALKIPAGEIVMAEVYEMEAARAVCRHGVPVIVPAAGSRVANWFSRFGYGGKRMVNS